MVKSELAGICGCGSCWCCRPFRPLLLYGGGQYNDAGASSRARLCIIISYNPIRLWWSLHSPAFVVVDRVGALGLSARCCMGDSQLSLEHWHRGTSIGVDHCNCFLVSYPTMVQSVLGY